MAYCAEHALPHSVLLGRPCGPGEALWTGDDEAKLNAWLVYNAAICSSCGSSDEDWLDDKGKRLEHDILEPAVRHCYGCAEMEKLREYLAERGEFGTSDRMYLRAATEDGPVSEPE